MKIKKYIVLGIWLGGVIFCAFFLLKFLQKTAHRNIVFVTVDALRADHLSCYGYKRITSPNIDKLAGEGVSFLNFFATSCTTQHATPALFTGKYLGVYSLEVLTKSFNNVLDDKFTTLAEYLKGFNYETAAFLENVHLRSGTGFEQGFNTYKDFSGNAQSITDKVITFLKNYRSKKPFFIWVHYVDVHSPYFSPEDPIGLFAGDSLYKEGNEILKLNLDDNSSPYRSKGYIPKIVFRKGHYSLNYYIACYDAAIRYVDFHIGRLLKNVDKNTLIIVTADHGESLGEHDTYFHHENLYDEALHVPLIIKNNNFFKGGITVSQPACSIDIVPTVLREIDPLKYFFIKKNLNGIDLKLMVRNKNIRRPYIYFYAPGIHGVRNTDENIKYSITNNKKEELYYMPDENNNLASRSSRSVPSLLEAMRSNADAWYKNYPIRSDVNLTEIDPDKKIKDEARKMGYW